MPQVVEALLQQRQLLFRDRPVGEFGEVAVGLHQRQPEGLEAAGIEHPPVLVVKRRDPAAEVMGRTEGLPGRFRDHGLDPPAPLRIAQPESPAGVRGAKAAVGDQAGRRRVPAHGSPTPATCAQRERSTDPGYRFEELASCSFRSPVLCQVPIAT